MSNMFDYSNSTALITGASSGIGAAMAEALPQRGCSIILSARDATKLEARSAQLLRAYNVNVAVVTADLSQPNGVLDLQAEIVRRGLAVDLLVNNAGFGLTGPFLSHALSEEEAQVQVNVTSHLPWQSAVVAGLSTSRHSQHSSPSSTRRCMQLCTPVQRGFVARISPTRRSCACCLSGTRSRCKANPG